jgi:hypothetical protein
VLRNAHARYDRGDHHHFDLLVSGRAVSSAGSTTSRTSSRCHVLPSLVWLIFSGRVDTPPIAPSRRESASSGSSARYFAAPSQVCPHNERLDRIPCRHLTQRPGVMNLTFAVRSGMSGPISPTPAFGAVLSNHRLTFRTCEYRAARRTLGFQWFSDGNSVASGHSASGSFGTMRKGAAEYYEDKTQDDGRDRGRRRNWRWR